MYAHVIGKKSALLSQHLQRQINPDILKGAQFLESSESSGTDTSKHAIFRKQWDRHFEAIPRKQWDRHFEAIPRKQWDRHFRKHRSGLRQTFWND
ncbi:MAG: hypothetical protein ACI9LO_002916 [Planctomycetota bacterium]|jgi:hypothetical protein